MTKWIVILLIAIFPAAGCFVGPQRPYVDLREVETLSQRTADKPGESPLRIVVSPSLSNRDTAGYYRQLVEHIAIQTGHPTELIYRRNNSEVQALLSTNGADIAFFSTGTFLTYTGPVAIESLVVPVRTRGPFYQALIIVPGDSNVQTVADLKGKSFAFNDSLSFSGHIFPLQLLKQLHATPETFFRQTIFTHSHSSSLQAVAMHRIDGAAIDSIAFDHARKNSPEIANAVKVIHSSPPVGTGPVVIRTAIDDAKKDLLRTVLLNMHHNQDMNHVLRELMFERFMQPPANLYDYPMRILSEMKNTP